MKKYLILGGLGLGVFYVYYRMRQKTQPTIPGAKTPSVLSQIEGAFGYPFKMGNHTRVDNANQPWYTNGSKTAVSSGNNSSDLQRAASSLGAGANIVHSLSDIWGNVSDYFGGSTEPGDSTVGSSDDLLPDDYDTYMPASGLYSDNSVGEAYDDTDYSDIGFDDSSGDFEVA